MQVTVNLGVEHAEGIKNMFFFHRVHGVDGDDSGWSEGLSMNPAPGGYALTASGDRLIGTSGITSEASVSYQFVYQKQNDEYVRSTVYSDLSLSPCGGPPPDEILIIPGLIIVTPTFPVIK
jgi:hypothetical protein